VLQNNWAAFALIGIGVVLVLALLWLEPAAPLAPLKDLEIEDRVVGTGPEAKPGDRVKVHYTGRLRADRSQFDSSIDRGEPYEFTLGQGEVIPGWDEGVVGMKVGGKRILSIPAAKAYGDRGQGKIPPRADLVFEIELLDIPKQLANLEIDDIKIGEGAEAKPGNRVQVHYTGRLLSNGKQFDSSIGKKPFSFTLGKGEVIPGWDEGVVGMKVGGKRVLRIPARLAYGRRGMPPEIPGNADLIFDVELLSVQ